MQKGNDRHALRRVSPRKVHACAYMRMRLCGYGLLDQLNGHLVGFAERTHFDRDKQISLSA